MVKRTSKPPEFVMWNSISGKARGWQRQWFGDELDPTTVFNIRGLGIREPMFNANVHRPIGTGDWLMMYFHQPARLDPKVQLPSVKAKTLILWPPGAEQFYSWGRSSDVEPHSWIHVEGTWIVQQVKENRLPIAKPIEVTSETLITTPLRNLMDEMNETAPDPVILQNTFQNWIRRIARHIRTQGSEHRIPKPLLNVRNYLDEHFTETTPLDKLAEIARISRSHLCHQFREHFETTISSYIIRRRMSVAQRLLFDLDLKPGEIAKEVGYSDIYQFSKQFKKSFGVSPTNYRRRLSGGSR